jgi:predicted Zn finger-like uncharacterized protein
MPEVVTCPKCERQLRVPDELIGQRVKCPTCGTNFTATVGGSSSERRSGPANLGQGERTENGGESRPSGPELSRPGGLDYDAGLPTAERRQQALKSLLLPAIFLMILGALGAVFFSVYAIKALTVPLTVKDLVAQDPNVKGQEAQAESLLRVVWGQGGAVLASVFMLMSILMVVAAIAMLVRRGRWLAILGSVAAMANIGCCCVAALPFGLWALIVLLNEDVKNAFH